MIYKLTTGNYCDFSKFRENVLEPRAYFIPFSNRDEMDKTDIRTERYNSSKVAVLSGSWKFKYYEKQSMLPSSFDSDKESMDKVDIPSTWQHTGYERPFYVNQRYQFPVKPPEIPTDCPVAVYSKKFHIDEVDGNYTLTFLGVAPCFDLFINGKFVGYNEGSHNTAEFEIKEFMVNGVNEIVVAVYKFCNGSYLEAQDMFRDNGVFRDVLLTRTGSNSIYDFVAETTKNESGTYNLKVVPTFKLTDECEFKVELFDGDSEINSITNKVSVGNVCTVTMSALNVDQWSAETPKLYTLYLSLIKNGEVIEVVRKKIGFKTVEIKKNVFYFNGEKIKILGVNHHDTNSKTGFAMTVEDMELDVKTIKDFNGNAVRTSHYPPDPTFLDLCDEYGLYVIDEADIETHGCCSAPYRPNLISNDKTWGEHYWDRVYRMYQRDRNHPSITMWSLGNEAGGIKNQDYCYNNLKKLTSIPIHYEGAVRSRRFSYDVHSEMYTHSNKVMKIAKRKISRKYLKRPFFLCEYAHAMGVGAGSLEDYMQAFYKADHVMGGCIWEFVDHATFNENGQYKYTYGGDHGEFIHDSNFCVDGLFFPDRTPHSGALNMKCAYRPVRVSKITDNTYKFDNKRYFKSADDITAHWVHLINGEAEKRGAVALNIKPQQSQEITLDIGSVNAKFDNVVVFTYIDNSGKEVAKEQVVLTQAKSLEIENSVSNIKVSPVENKLEILFDNGSILFDKSKGEIESYIYNGVEMLNQSPINYYRGFGIELYRAPFDNDMNMRKNWDKLALSQLVCRAKKCTVTENKTNVVIELALEGNTPIRYLWTDFVARLDMKYVIYSNGRIVVETKLNTLMGVRNLPRFGVSLEMPKNFDNVAYYGLGEQQNLNDFKEHAVLGTYHLKVRDMHEKYIKPQESGMRSEVRYATVTNNEGQGLRFDFIDKHFTFNANHYTVNQLSKCKHQEDVHEMDTTNVHIDGFMMGAGSNSCGQRPLNKYKIDVKAKPSFSFVVTPLPFVEEVNGDNYEPVEIVKEEVDEEISELIEEQIQAEDKLEDVEEQIDALLNDDEIFDEIQADNDTQAVMQDEQTEMENSEQFEPEKDVSEEISETQQVNAEENE